MAQWLNGSMAQCVKFSRLRLFGTFAVLALGLSGCTSAVEDVASTPSDIFEPVRALQFPLDEYLALIDDIGLSDEDIIRQFERNNLREDELVTQCMHEAGFEYDPENVPGFVRERTPGRLATFWRPDDPEWVTQWGYGISAQPEGMVSRSNSVDALSVFSPAWFEAFTVALRGPRCTDVPGAIISQESGVTSCQLPEASTPEQAAEFGGCQGQARAQMRAESPSGLQYEDEFAPLFRAINQMRSDLNREPSPAELDWVNCMADAGFAGFPRRIRPMDATPDIGMVMGNVTGMLLPPYPEQRIWDARTDAMNSGDSARFREIPQLEIDMALADLNCRVEVDFHARENARRVDAETQFVTDNRAALEALRDAAEQRAN